MVKEVPRHLINYYPNAIVSPDGVVLYKGKIELESLYAPSQKTIFKGIFQFYYNWLRFFIRNKRGTYLLAFDAWSFGYFHWMTEFIPRLFMIKNLIEDHTVIIPNINNGIWNKASAWRSLYRKSSALPRGGYFKGSLEAFHLKSIYRHDARTPLLADRICLSSHVAPSGNYNDQIMRDIRQFYFAHYEISQAEPYRLVYISRAQATRRHIENEKEVIERVRCHGFEIFQFENLTLLDQITLLSQTKYLIGQHGAALTNIMFMNENSFALELKAEGDFQNLCYFSLASAMNVNYLYQFCRTDGRSVQNANIIVDLPTLSENIKLVLK